MQWSEKICMNYKHDVFTEMSKSYLNESTETPPTGYYGVFYLNKEYYI